jgi:hypothetical protein
MPCPEYVAPLEVAAPLAMEMFFELLNYMDYGPLDLSACGFSWLEIE